MIDNPFKGLQVKGEDKKGGIDNPFSSVQDTVSVRPQPSSTSSGIEIPEQYRATLERAAKAHGVPVSALAAIAHQESRFNPDAVNKKTQATGMFQFIPATAKAFGIDPRDPEQSANATAKMMADYMAQGHSLEEAIKHHHAGPNREIWGPKTEAYGKEVFQKASMLGLPIGGAIDNPFGGALKQMDSSPGGIRKTADSGAAPPPDQQQVLPGEPPSIALDMEDATARKYLPDFLDTGLSGFSLGKLIDTISVTDLPIFSIFSRMAGIDDKVIEATQGVRDGVTASYLRAAGLMSDKSADLFSGSFWGIPALDGKLDPTTMFTGQPVEEWAKLVMGSREVAQMKHGMSKTTERYEQELGELLEAEGVGTLRRISRDSTRFLLPYMMFSKITGPGKAAQNYIAAPLADLAAFSHREERLGNSIADANIPFISPAVEQYMVSKPDDSEALGMFKQALEGVLLGKITDTVGASIGAIFHGAKAVKAKIKGQTTGVDPSQKGMPISSPKGWKVEELDTKAAEEARKLLSGDLQIAEGENVIEAAVGMYKRNLETAGVWKEFDPEDQVAKLEWFAQRAQNTFDEAGHVVQQAPKVDAVSLDQWNTLWKQNNKKVDDYFKAQEAKAKGVKAKVKGLDKALFDRSGPLRDELERTPEGALAARRFALSAGATAKASREAEIAVREVYEQKLPGVPFHKALPKEKRELLDELISIRRYKVIKGYNPKWSEKGNVLTSQSTDLYAARMDQMREQLGEAEFGDLMRRANTFFENIAKPLDDLLDAGVISKDEWQKLTRFSYSPVKWIETLDTPVAQYRGKDGRAISINKSGIEPLSSGSKQLVDTNTEFFLEEAIMRSNSIAVRNRANQALYGFAKAHPDNQVVRLKRPKGMAKEDWVEVKVMQKGEPKPMYIAKEYVDQWATSNSLLNEKARKFISYGTGAPVTRYFATGPANPEFALSNFPRDVMYNILVSDQYSGFLPLAGKQYAEDIAEVMSDAVFRKGQYVDYINQGGGMEFLSQQGIPGNARPVKTAKGDIENVLAYFNTTSEIINRLAVRNRAVKNMKKSVAKQQGIRPEEVILSRDQLEEATFIARTTIDFDQGGKTAKAVNEGVPYFNAAMQGLRGYARSWKKNPAKAAAYVGQLMGLYGTLHYLNRTNEPEATADTPTYIRDNYFTMTTPLSFVDEEGDRRYLGLRFPVDHSTRGLKIAAEALIDKSLNKGKPSDIEVDAIDTTKRILESQLGIVPGATVPPLAGALMAYGANKDWWRNSPVWTGEQNIPAEMEFEPGKTSEIARDVGNVTGLSPARLQAATKQIMPSSVFSWGIGTAYKELTKELPRDQLDPIEKHQIEEFQKNPFVRRFTFLTSPHAKEADSLDESIEEANTPLVQVNRNVDNLSQRVTQGDMEIQDAMEWVQKEVPMELRGKATERLLDSYKIETVVKHLGYTDAVHLPSRRWWKRLASAPAAAKAKELSSHLAAIEHLEDPKERKQAKRMIQAMMSQVPGFNPSKSEEFAFYLKRELERQGLDPNTALN